MPESNGNGRTQVLIAIIGLAGVLGTAIVTNWDKIFPKQPTAASHGTSSPETGANFGADKHSKDSSKGAGKSDSLKDPKKVKPIEPDPVKPVPLPEKPKTYSIDGRLTDQRTGKLLCTGMVSVQVTGVHQVQRADADGRYAFELAGFAPEDELILSARVPNYQEIHLTWKLSELKHLENLQFAPDSKPKKGAAVGAAIGGLAGGGKGSAARPASPTCSDSSGTVPAYEPRPDSSRMVKGTASGSYP